MPDEHFWSSQASMTNLSAKLFNDNNQTAITKGCSTCFAKSFIEDVWSGPKLIKGFTMHE